jgi:hypothetical protein
MVFTKPEYVGKNNQQMYLLCIYMAAIIVSSCTSSKQRIFAKYPVEGQVCVSGIDYDQIFGFVTNEITFGNSPPPNCLFLVAVYEVRNSSNSPLDPSSHNFTLETHDGHHHEPDPQKTRELNTMLIGSTGFDNEPYYSKKTLMPSRTWTAFYSVYIIPDSQKDLTFKLLFDGDSKRALSSGKY